MLSIATRNLQNGFIRSLAAKANYNAYSISCLRLTRSYHDESSSEEPRRRRYNDSYNNHNDDNYGSRNNRYGSRNGRNNNSRSNWNNNNNNYRSNYRNGHSKPKRVSNRRIDVQGQLAGDVRFQPETLNKLVQLSEEDLSDDTITLQSLLDDGIISHDIYNSIKKMKFDNLTRVQQLCIKQVLNEKYADMDMITRAKTGTGKTFAFLIPIFEHLIALEKNAHKMGNKFGGEIHSVIIVPTRDLAFQIKDEAEKIYKNDRKLKRFASVVSVGGTSYGANIRELDRVRPSIIIATPGRLQQLLEEYGDKYFSQVDIKVLDEADRLLDIGFSDALNQMSASFNDLNGNSPNHIKTWLFSATLDQNVQKLSNNIMNKENCLFIDTVDKNEPEAHELIEQSLVQSPAMGYSIIAALDHIIKTVQDPELKMDYKAIVFTPTVKSTIFVTQLLRKLLAEYHLRIPLFGFHGRITQARRTNMVTKFKALEKGILVCTDVAARGMDFPNIKEVLQIGVPNGLSNYIHRIGRTARSGKTGKSIIFLADWEQPFISKLEKHKNVTVANVINNDVENNSESKALQEKISELIEESKVQRFRRGQDDNANLEQLMKESIFSLMSFYQTCMSEYEFNPKFSMLDISKIYGILTDQPDAKLPMTGTGILEKIGIKYSMIREMVEIVYNDPERVDNRFKDYGMSYAPNPSRELSAREKKEIEEDNAAYNERVTSRMADFPNGYGANYKRPYLRKNIRQNSYRRYKEKERKF